MNGQEDWIYIHLEIQGSEQSEFAKRMFVYNYRIFDKYDRPVASMAVLADDSLDWKPQTYGFDVLGCQHTPSLLPRWPTFLPVHHTHLID